MSVDPTDPALVAAVDEAVTTAVNTIDWNGVSIAVPVSEADDLDLDTMEAFENGKAVTALRSLFGSDEYERARVEFKKIHGRRPKASDLNALAGAIAEHFGFEDAGE